MKLFLLLAVFCLCGIALAAGECVDKGDNCNPKACYGSALKSCPKTCDDCDGSKYDAFWKVFNGKECVDAYPTDLCKAWANSKDEKFGCKGEESSVRFGCRKTCGSC